MGVRVALVDTLRDFLRRSDANEFLTTPHLVLQRVRKAVVVVVQWRIYSLAVTEERGKNEQRHPDRINENHHRGNGQLDSEC